MENTTTNFDMALLWVAGLIFVFLIIFGVEMYLSERFKDINYAKMELCRAYDEDEYRYWRRELTICRLLLIPFMSYERAKRIVRFFSRGRHAKKEKHNDGLTSLLLPSFLGIMICAVCLAGGTFAWFTASQTTSTQVIQAANYSIVSTVNDGTTDITADNGIYSLESDKTYTVKIEATGSATTGYCIIKIGDTDIHTEPFPTKDNADKKSITFTLKINQATDMQIVAQWGSSTKNESDKLKDRDTYKYGEVVESNNDEDVRSVSENSTSSLGQTEESSVETKTNEAAQSEEITNNEETSEVDETSEEE